MKIKNLLSAIALLAVASVPAHAQQDPLVSQYMFNGLFLSPAYAGVRNAPNITGVYRKQWVNMSGAPVTQTLSYDQRLGQKTGVGIILVNDKIGVTGQTDFFADYAYRAKLTKTLSLSLGLQGGVSNYRADLTKLQIWDQGDASFSNNITGKWIPNFGTGGMIYTDKYYAGISIPRILSYDPATFLHANLDRSPLYERHYYLTGGYEYTFKEKYTLKPSLLLKYVPAAPMQVDINLLAYYKQMLGVGFSYRTRNAMVFLFEFKAKKYVKVGYAFDYAFSDLAKYSAGSHELMLSFDLDKGFAAASFAPSNDSKESK